MGNLSKQRVAAAVIGSGNIGTDMMFKIMRYGTHLTMGAMVGIDAASDGLARASRLGVPTTADGIDGLIAMPEFKDIRIVFDATSASAHHRHDAMLKSHDVQVIDLTPAAVGPYVVPTVNLERHLGARNVNMVTCGGQATIPIVHAVARVTRVRYAEIIASIASRSAGPGTRANIDEFTETTSRAIESVGGAERGKAIIVLNPAEPPLMMRDTVYCLVDLDVDERAIEASIGEMVDAVRETVPGFRLKQKVQFERFDALHPLNVPRLGEIPGTKVSVFLEVQGAAHYLPAYAGNLDIMTSAALATAEQFAAALRQELDHA